MKSFRAGTRTVLMLLLSISILTPAIAGASAAGAPAGGPAEGTAIIANGNDPNVDGYLSVGPDDYGQWASVGFSGAGDLYNPVGALAVLEPTFSSALFLAVPSRQQHIVLTENAQHRAIADDFSLTISVTSPSVSSDGNGDGTDDTLMSSFNAIGTDTDLDFDLTQSIVSCDPGVAAIRQDYTITNNAALAVDLTLARVYDGDLLWDGDFANDQVGTTFNADGGARFVFEQEPASPEATITLSSASAESYFGGKQGIQPAGGPPPYDFGTDTEIFDFFGVPATWVNNIANVGYDTDGVSGPMPGGDGFAGLGWSISLAPGESTDVSIFHTYGAEAPCGGDADLSIEKLNSAGEGADVEIGDPVDYQLTVTNNGPDDATGVEVIDFLPPEVVAITNDCGGMNIPPFTWTIGDLAVDETVVCLVKVRAEVLGTAVNTATVAGDQNDPDPANNESTSTFDIIEVINPLEIPTLGTVGLAALVMLLGALGVRRLRRRA